MDILLAKATSRGRTSPERVRQVSAQKVVHATFDLEDYWRLIVQFLDPFRQLLPNKTFPVVFQWDVFIAARHGCDRDKAYLAGGLSRDQVLGVSIIGVR